MTIRSTSARMRALFVTMFSISLVWGVLRPSAVWAANDAPNTEELLRQVAGKTKELENRMEQTARESIRSIVDSERFLVTVELTLEQKKLQESSKLHSKVKLSLIPKEISAEAMAASYAASLSREDLEALVAKVRVDITLQKNTATDLDKLIQKVVARKLALNEKRGDAITVLRENIPSAKLDELEKRLQTVSTENSIVREERNRWETNARTFETDKQRLQQQLTQAEEKIKTLSGDLEAQKSQVVSAQKKNEELLAGETSALGQALRIFRGAETPLALLISIVLLVGGMVAATLLFASAQKQNSERLATSLQGLAASLQKAGTGGMNYMRGGPSSNSNSMLETSALPQQLPAESRALLQGSAEPLDAIRAEAEVAWLELQKNRSVMLSVLKDWLRDPETAELFVGVSDAIGVENSRTIWSAFPRAEIDAVQRSVLRPPSRAAAYAGVVQLYRKVAYEISNKPSYYGSIDFAFLAAHTDEELVAGVEKVVDDAAACALIFLSPKRASALLDKIPTDRANTLVASMARLSNLGEADATKYLESVKQACKTEHRQNAFDISGHLSVIVGAATGERRTSLNSTIENDASLRDQFKQKLLSMDDVLAIDDEILGELIGNLDPENLAALTLTLSEEQSQRIGKLLSPRNSAMLNAELERIRAKPSLRKRGALLGRQLQDSLINEVKNLVSQGVVELESSDEQRKVS